MKRLWAVTSAIVCVVRCAGANILLSDFNSTGLEYAYGSWNGPGAVVNGSSYLTIQSPATPSGGGGVGLSSLALNASNYYVSLTARLGSANQASQLNVVLLDRDGGSEEAYVYFFLASWFNPSTFTTIHIPATMPSWTNNVIDGIINFDTGGNGLVGWQLQGNYANNTDTLNFEIDHLQLTAIPEPGTAVLGVIGAALATILARLKKREP